MPTAHLLLVPRYLTTGAYFSHPVISGGGGGVSSFSIRFVRRANKNYPLPQHSKINKTKAHQILYTPDRNQSAAAVNVPSNPPLPLSPTFTDTCYTCHAPIPPPTHLPAHPPSFLTDPLYYPPTLHRPSTSISSSRVAASFRRTFSYRSEASTPSSSPSLQLPAAMPSSAHVRRK